MALSEAEELELLELEKERAAAAPQQLPAGAETAMRLGRRFLQAGPLGVAAEGVGMAMDSIDKYAVEGGGLTADLVAKTGAPAEVAGAAGTAVRMLPAVLGGKLGQSTGRPLVEKGAQALMQQSLSPTSKTLANGQAAKAIDTMLQEGVPATASGAAKLRMMVSQLKREVAQRISQSPESVNRGHAYKELATLLDDVSAKGAGYKADQAAILKAWDEFKNHPLLDKFAQVDDMIPMQLADKVKRASQKAAEQAYDALTTPTAADRAQQAIARGLKKGMNEADAVVAAKNAKISEYMNALNVLEPRAAIAANKQIGGLAPAASTAEGAMIMLADRNPWLKSYIARVLYEGRNTIPAGAGAVAGAGVPYQDRNE